MKYVTMEEAKSYVTAGAIERLTTYASKKEGVLILGYLKSDAATNYVVEVAHVCPCCQRSDTMLANGFYYLYCPHCLSIYNLMSYGLTHRGTIHSTNSHYTDMCREYICMENKIRPPKETDYFVV